MGVQLHEDRMGVLGVTLSPAAVAPNTTGEQFFPVRGLRVTDVVNAVKATVQPGLIVAHARCSAPDTLAIHFANTSAASITPTPGEAYQLWWFRAENAGKLPSVLQP
jgi:hypothetical protein